MWESLLLCLALQDTAFHWSLGQRVHTNNTVYARADSSPTGTILSTRGIGDKGTLIGGPIGPVADGSIRWKVAYDVPPSGWSTQRYLSLDSTPVPALPPPPPPPPAPPPAPPPVSWDTVVAIVAVQPASVTGFLTGASDTMRFDTAVLSAVGTIRPCALTWTVANPAVAKAIPPSVIGLTRGTTTFTVACGAIRSHPVQVQFDTLPTPKLPAPQIQLSVTGARVTNQPSRPYVHFPAVPLWTGLDSLQLFGGLDTTVIAGYARCWVVAP